MGELDPLYRQIDELLELRARDYPRRVEPTWSELQRCLDELSGRLRKKVHEGPPGSPPVWPLGDALEAPVFVVGYPKSGTTLLNGLLDAHPQLLVIPSESKHFSDFGPDTGGLGRDGKLDALQARWVPRLVNPTGQAPFWLLGRPWELGDDPYLRFSARLYALGRDRPGQDLLSVLAAALESSGDAGIRAWVEKTPDHLFQVDRILRTYPRARFVQIVRDPRATAAAVARFSESGWGSDVLATSEGIESALAAAHEHSARLGGDRYHVVKYEQLVGFPEQEMRRLAAFLGVDYSPRLLEPTAGGSPLTANSGWADRRVVGTIHSLSVGDPEAGLDARSLELVVARTSSGAQALGYDLPRVGRLRRLVVTARARARRTASKAKRVGRMASS